MGLPYVATGNSVELLAPFCCVAFKVFQLSRTACYEECFGE